LFIFAFAPPWASERACAESGAHCPPAPSRYRAAARAAAAIAARYPKLVAIEIWNEPNTPYFWAPRADPLAYARLLKACYGAIKRANPSMRVAGGSMSSSPFSDRGYVRAGDFLRGIYESGGIRDMDVISVHAYPNPADTTADSAVGVVQSVRGVRDRYGQDQVPIWITETGVSTTGDDATPEDVQALVMLRLYERLRDEEGVEMILFHTLVDPPNRPDDPEGGYGVVASTLRPKPAYCALSSAWGGRAC
jgi:polysaccharide biosynthesis protein PslG